MGDAPNFSIAQWTEVKFKLGLDFPITPYYLDNDETGLKLTDAKAIIKYVALKYGPESLLGTTVEQKGTVEMLADILTDAAREATLMCYDKRPNREELAEKMMFRMESIEKYLEVNSSSKFLLGSEPCYADFMLFELCERVQWITESKLFKQLPRLQRFH